LSKSAAQETFTIELTDVSRRFVTPKGDSLLALRDFNMQVRRGEFVAIVGPTGSGKSTTLNLITGIWPASSGEVRVMGKQVTEIDAGIGFVFQSDALFPWRNVLKNVAAGPRFRGQNKATAYAAAREWIARVGLAGFEYHYPHQLSGGMRKRVTLAQTLINEPKIILMDEPFSALDVQTRVVMQDELLKLWSTSGASVVFVTHDLDEAIALADRVYVLTAAPATVKSIYEIHLPRPRVISEIRYDQRFIDLSREIWNDLRQEVQPGRAVPQPQVA
jgi:NitT/TauT family transport system ATP-binding protein